MTVVDLEKNPVEIVVVVPWNDPEEALEHPVMHMAPRSRVFDPAAATVAAKEESLIDMVVVLVETVENAEKCPAL